jgi:hypothetical protein
LADIEHLARLTYDPDYEPPVPDYQFSGLPWMLTQHDAWFVWRAWENHGVMPYAGGLLDQPPEWRKMIETFQAAYGASVDAVKQEVRARKRDGS